MKISNSKRIPSLEDGTQMIRTKDSAGEQVLAKFKKVLGIVSPSKKFYEATYDNFRQ